MSEVQVETLNMGPGQLLKSARERAELSVQDIAQKLHLKSSVISDIEEDHYDSNISLTFIKGYLKLYAKQVMVTEAEIVNAFETLNTQKKEPVKLQSFSRRVANQANDDKLMVVSCLILAVVLALVVIWWFQQSYNEPAMTVPHVAEPEYKSAENITEAGEGAGTLKSVVQQSHDADTEIPNEDEQSTVDSMASQSPGQEQEQAEDIPLAGETQRQTSPVTQQNNKELLAEDLNPLTQSTITEQAVVDQLAVALADPVQLVFKFSGDCWMNLSDATGEDIAYGVKVQGRVMTVSGVPPFTVTLGAPQVVQISYGGEAVDMSNFKDGNTAKFTLPIS